MEQNEFITTVRRGAVLVVGAFLFGIAANYFNPGGYRFLSPEAISESRIVEIGVDEAKIKFDHSSALFIDTRDGDDYFDARIEGAINVPGFPESLSEKTIKEQFRIISRPLEAVLYCDEGCDSAAVIGRRLLEMGYPRKVYILQGGFGAWAKKKHPLEKSPDAGGR